ncbi:hypothetical protein FHP25_31350 [Vineibacter terrae]|uniref:Guanylate cyclase domain-containing protein n=1 Tax=Vineibacter terrae TaxID=2586908 RepID=A0A5C8PCC0_9HYPH|nr:adenylate/guanylate cyclase domain-containing protein [Vineibacter terrae]TXL71103.1 hypothetical protein FHP25_31350 [Vineibacter terrae]
MKCPRCHQLNRDGARFCDGCGAPLAGRCAGCDGDLPPGARFCPHCGQPAAAATPAAASSFGSPQSYTPRYLAEKILISKAALEGERKLVTVLFADLKGSMEMLAERDPEEARKLIDPVLERMMEAVHHYEGTVSLVMGDGIMALFGAPLAVEDHAVRACYAALRMQEQVRRYADEARRRHGVNVQIRVGLNSGEVVVRAVGSDLHMDYSAVGRTTHLAARMEQLASPGSILLTASTLEMVEGFVAVEKLGRVPVKGLADAVEVYEATGAGPVRTRLQAAARRGLTQFVGREHELEQLRRAQRLAAGGQGQVVAIVAEAGVGKSRLVHEFIHGHDLQDWLVVECAAVSYGKSTSYLPVINLLRSYFDIHDRDDLQVIGDKVAAKVLALDAAMASALPALQALLDVPVRDAAWQAVAPGQRRQETLDALRRLALGEARKRPVLLIFHDLHWIDGETQALLDGLVESLGSERVLLLVTYRPEHRDGWGGKPCYGQLRLDALSAASAERFLQALLGDDPGLAPLKQLLARNGNPFFLEETVRTLVETGALAGQRGHYLLAQPIQAIQVPPSVQAVLAARIDRLSQEDKRLLQTASVIGKEVPLALLQAVSELSNESLRGALDRLKAAEFLDETELFPDLLYAFKHALTLEVAYGGLLHERRRDLHGRIVGAIETQHRDRLEEQTERLAHHALRGELQHKAVGYLRQAGARSAARSALLDAQDWFEHALGVLQALPPDRATLEQGFEVRLELRHLLVQFGEARRSFERLREAEALAEQLDDDARRGRVFAFATNVLSLLGRLDEALAVGIRALQIAERQQNLRLRIQTTTYLEQVHYHRAEHERVVELASANLASLPGDWVYENLGSATPAAVFDRCWAVMSLAELGRFDAAAPLEAEMLRLAAPTHHATTISQAHFAAGRLRLARGDWDAARAHFERAMAVCRSGHIDLGLPRAVAACAWVLARDGAAGAAMDLLGEGRVLVARLAAQGSGGHLGWAYVSLGHAALLLGRAGAARELGGQALDCAAAHPGVQAHAHHLLGEAMRDSGDGDAQPAESHYRQALALAAPCGMRPLIAHCHHGLGTLLRDRGTPQAQTHLDTATALYREMDMRSFLD